jgi:hypothetical protein
MFATSSGVPFRAFVEKPRFAGTCYKSIVTEIGNLTERTFAFRCVVVERNVVVLNTTVTPRSPHNETRFRTGTEAGFVRCLGQAAQYL